jgi:membrane-associated phospholipid phosphatase
VVVVSIVMFVDSICTILKLKHQIYQGDEAIVYPFSFLIGFSLLYMASTPEQGFAARRLLRIYGDFGAVCLGEAGLKLLIQRERPPYKKRSDFICMLGEHNSFPSGHAARAGYAAVVFASQVHGPNFNLLTYLPSFIATHLATLLKVWAGAVCLSRVALGKHYVSDVVVGVLLGGFAATWWPLVNPQGGWRLLLSLTFTAEIVYIMATPSVRKDIKGWPYLLGIVIGFWITFPYAV